MSLNSQTYSEVSSYLYALSVCVLACFIWLFLGRNRASKYINTQNSSIEGRLGNFDDETDSETKQDFKKEICTSLSCIRCSKTVYTSENLLKKWSEIEHDFPDPNTRDRIRNGILNTSERPKENSQNVRNLQEPTLFNLEGLTSQILYTSQDYSSEVSILEKETTLRIFLKEFMNVYRDLDDSWVSNKVPSGGWYLFYLVNQGVKIEKNCVKCPKAMQVIERLESAMLDCAFGNVVFSVLLPGTSIGRHCGPTNVRIRCHVPLKAPQGYFISVAGEERSWQLGEILIFDDSFYHEVYCLGNKNEPRVVLMIDLWHPSLSLREREIIKKLFSPLHIKP